MDSLPSENKHQRSAVCGQHAEFLNVKTGVLTGTVKYSDIFNSVSRNVVYEWVDGMVWEP